MISRSLTEMISRSANNKESEEKRLDGDHFD
jgi:hypothetical protein